MTEKDFEAVWRRSCGVWFPGRHRIRKHHADQFSGAGHPDFYGHILGKYVEFELKVAPNRPTEVQVAQLIETLRTGGAGFLVIHENHAAHLIMAQQLLTGFSYRQRSSWVTLPEMTYATQTKTKETCLDLTPLKALLF